MQFERNVSGMTASTQSGAARDGNDNFGQGSSLQAPDDVCTVIWPTDVTWTGNGV
jgi:hypothetical protein